MKVNMTPNPLDVVTIHASQGDSEARQWEFELHNNGELIDTSEVTEQMFFKAYKGGTEQLLPENTSTPTTTPILADIQYPDGLRTDQYFTYRETPTTVSNKARIKTIKGNTLVWIQLVQNGNFADSSGWSTVSSASLTIGNNIANITTVDSWSGFGSVTGWNLVSGHKYLFSASYIIRTTNYEVNIYSGNLFDFATIPCVADNQWHTIQQIITCVQSGHSSRPSFDNRSASGSYSAKNIMLIDLTQMGLDITDPSDFTSLFPLSYYSYNQGSLLSFMGNGIKTVGFNQWDEEWENGRINSDGTKASSSTYIRSKNYIHIFPNTTYYRKSPNNIQPFYYDGNMNFISYGLWGANSTFSTPNNAEYMLFHIDPAYGTTYNNDICINISNTELNGTYEPYTSSTLSLPISTYFPSGMKSAGNVYDELTNSKAITRIGKSTIDGSNVLSVGTTSGGIKYAVFDISVLPNASNLTINVTTVKYLPINTAPSTDGYIRLTGSSVYIYDNSFTDLATVQSLLNTNPLDVYYELATPTETSFTTASLVTENAEITLSNNDGVLIGKCTEQLSENPGFIDAKIKLSDGDGECYSNKLQLHIERKPS